MKCMSDVKTTTRLNSSLKPGKLLKRTWIFLARIPQNGKFLKRTWIFLARTPQNEGGRRSFLDREHRELCTFIGK